VDYPNQMTYWQPGHPAGPGDLDIIGLTLRPEADGSYTIVGIADRDGALAVAGIEPGDMLKSIDNLDVPGLSMGPVIDALRGIPGDSRLLVVEREGRRLEIEAEVIRLP
jgi:C-terminal processing protease CtpA/Prc